jgi:thiamine-phosphate pyrophosphorylase
LKTGAVTLARFYPIVPDYDWLARIVPLGVELVQLRIKDADRAAVVEQTRQALELTRRYGCQLILNDYWDIAIETGVDFIHLGQDDLRSADVAALKQAGIRLGVSTHDEAELATALAVQPNYVALGPVYETKLKKMPWAPQGLERLRDWRAKIGSLPLVAIGGLTPERAAGALEAGADSLAVITDFFTAADPEARVRQWLKCVEAAR